MANTFDANYEQVTLTWLRGPGGQALRTAAVGPSGGLPEPVVMARGPRNLVGPSAALAAGEWWEFGLQFPATPDYAWVLIQDEILVRYSAGDQLQALYVFPTGQPGTQNTTRGPVCGPGTGLSYVVTGAAGNTIAFVPSAPRPKSLWIPIDPLYTDETWQTCVALQAPAGTGINQDTLNIVCETLRFVGYPVTAWQTGALWDVPRARGT